MFDAHFGPIQKFVGFGDGLDGFRAKVLSLQGDDVDATRPSRKTFGQHVRRNVLQDAAQPAHKAIAADRCEVMDCHTSAQGCIVLYMNVSAEHDGIGHDDAVFDFAVVSYVRAGHQIALVTNAGDAVFFFGASIDRHRFAKDVAIPDDDLRRRALVAEVLGFTADDAAGKEVILTSDGRMSGDRHMAFQTCATPDLGMRANNTKRPNPNFIVEFGSRVYHSGVGDDRGHEFLFQT